MELWWEGVTTLSEIKKIFILSKIWTTSFINCTAPRNRVFPKCKEMRKKKDIKSWTIILIWPEISVECNPRIKLQYLLPTSSPRELWRKLHRLHNKRWIRLRCPLIVQIYELRFRVLGRMQRIKSQQVSKHRPLRLNIESKKSYFSQFMRRINFAKMLIFENALPNCALKLSYKTGFWRLNFVQKFFMPSHIHEYVGTLIICDTINKTGRKEKTRYGVTFIAEFFGKKTRKENAALKCIFNFPKKFQMISSVGQILSSRKYAFLEVYLSAALSLMVILQLQKNSE